MENKGKILRRILGEYDSRRMAREREARERREAVFAALPQLAALDRHLKEQGLSAVRLTINDPAGAVAGAKRLAEQAKRLRRERETLLIQAGYPADYLEVHYDCPLCQDTGYVGNQMCTCLKRQLLAACYSQSRLAQSLQTENFDYFDFRLYSDQLDPAEGKSPRENIQNIFDRAIDFVEGFPQTFANLLLYGDTGLGKTFLCNCIAKEILDKGHTVLYLTAGEFCRLAEDAQFRRRDEEDEEDPLADLMEVDLLILDDLGTEFATVLTTSALFQVLNQRILTQRHTIISTNLSPERLRDAYSDRILSRLVGSYDFLHFFGKDIRMGGQG